MRRGLRPRSRFVQLVPLVALCTLGLTSCGGPSRVEVSPVKGQVLYRGQPAPFALVILYPQGGSEEVKKLRPTGRAGTDGYFTLTTYQDGDGAPAGEYKVTVAWPGENPADPSDPNDAEGRIPRGPDRLQGRYSDPATTPLTMTIGPGANDIPPIQLQ